MRTAVVIDYQNLHITGSKLFYPHDALHEHLIHPLSFATCLLEERNARQDPTREAATLSEVLVYRGLPSPDHDPDANAWNLAHQSEWEKDPRVAVHHRPLRYEYEYTADHRKATDIHGKPIVKGKREKGIDVLCALAVLRKAADPEIDLVILASQDTDLEPALAEARDLRQAKIETVSWFDKGKAWSSREIRVEPRVWNTRLNLERFERCVDRTAY